MRSDIHKEPVGFAFEFPCQHQIFAFLGKGQVKKMSVAQKSRVSCCAFSFIDMGRDVVNAKQYDRPTRLDRRNTYIACIGYFNKKMVIMKLMNFIKWTMNFIFELIIALIVACVMVFFWPGMGWLR